MDWFSLALVSAITLAAADALMKKYFNDYQGWELVIVRFLVPAIILVPLMVLFPLPDVPLRFWGLMALLIPLELAAMLLYVIAIRDSPLYLTLPYLAFTPVFSVVTGYLVLDETVSFQGFIGVLLVVIGGYLLNMNHFNLGSLSGWFAPLKAIVYERGSRLMLVAATIYSFTSVLSKYAMQYATPESFGPFYFGAIGFVIIIAILAFRPSGLRLLGRRTGALITTGFMMAIMVVTHFLAIASTEVAYMISTKRSSLLFGIIFGALLFKERHLLRHFIAGGIMVAGVALIVI